MLGGDATSSEAFSRALLGIVLGTSAVLRQRVDRRQNCRLYGASSVASNGSAVELGDRKSVYDTPALGRGVGSDDLDAGSKERERDRQQKPGAVERFDREHGEARPRRLVERHPRRGPGRRRGGPAALTCDGLDA